MENQKEEPKQDRTCTNNCSVVCGECQIFEHKQRLEKYSERFDNDKSLIGNPDTWGKRIIEEPKQKTLEEAAKQYAEIYRCPATNDNEYCKHDIISAFNNGAKWQQEQDKKCFHPLPYRLAKSDVNYECTLCGKFI